MSIPVTAVFDIGKTNKKFLLFDEEYRVIFETQTTLNESKDDDGYPCENIETLTTWIKNTLETAISDTSYNIDSLNFSAYGATIVNLDREGNFATPVYNYLKPYPKRLQDQFYQKYGGKDNFSVKTASPPMGMLNSGLQLYWLKKNKPRLFGKIHRSLHLPQYLSFIFTRECASELTSIGCHTGLWNFKKSNYHEWVYKEGIDSLLPSPINITETKNVDIDGRRIKIGLGIHDSSAALAPFLTAIEGPFILLSTGTWSISLNPFSREPLSYEELKKDCLCYKDIHGRSVKASRFFLGGELEHQLQKMNRYFNKSPEYFKEIQPDKNIIRKMAKKHDKKRMLNLESATNSGPYPDLIGDKTWDISYFQSYEEAYFQMMIDLVAIQSESLKLAIGKTNSDKLIITGGFGKNEVFMKLMASRFPDKEVYSVRLPQSSALGAATVMRSQNEQNTKLLQGRINLQRYIPIPQLNLSDYKWKGQQK